MRRPRKPRLLNNNLRLKNRLKSKKRMPEQR